MFVIAQGSLHRMNRGKFVVQGSDCGSDFGVQRILCASIVIAEQQRFERYQFLGKTVHVEGEHLIHTSGSVAVRTG